MVAVGDVRSFPRGRPETPVTRQPGQHLEAVLRGKLDIETLVADTSTCLTFAQDVCFPSPGLHTSPSLPPPQPHRHAAIDVIMECRASAESSHSPCWASASHLHTDGGVKRSHTRSLSDLETSGCSQARQRRRCSGRSSLGGLPVAAGAQGILWPVLHCPETADFLDSHPCPRGHRYFANQQGQVVLASAARVRSPANQTLLRWAKLADLPADRQPITDLMPDLQVQQVMSGINPFSMSPPSINPWSYPEAWADLAPVPSPSGSASPSRCSACSPAAHSLLSSLAPTSPPTICVIPEPQTRSLPPELLALSRQHPDEVAAAAALAAAAASLAAAEAVAQRGAAFITAFNELPPDHAAAVSATAAGARACVMAAAAAPGPPAAKYSSLISSLLALFKRTGPVAGQEDPGCLGPAAPDGDGWELCDD
ncbi:hypothetical protein V8C86DRAFT_2514854 [Haematococcus lacustris]